MASQPNSKLLKHENVLYEIKCGSYDHNNGTLVQL
jgi:hypothetical protein